MIILEQDKKYYILIDGQGATFASGRIFESLKEVSEQFKDYADIDGYEDPTLNGWTLSDCLENWCFVLKKYQVNDFFEVGEQELNYKVNE